MEPGMILHLLRNPWGHSDDEVRQARLAAADELERWRRTVDHPGSAVQWIAEMQPQLYALRARVAELEADAERFAWVLPIVSGDDDATADAHAMALALHLGRNLTGRAAIDAAMRDVGNKSKVRK